MLRSILIALIIWAIFQPAFSQEVTEFKSTESFLRSLHGAELRGFAEGDLFGKTRMDWVGIVASKGQDNEEFVEIYILEKLESGGYRSVDKSAPRPAFGGTGNFGYEDTFIKHKSVFVVFSYHWHSCAGNSTSQFKLTKNGWQLVGVESFETNSVDGSGIEISTSANLLTGNAIIKRIDNGKPRVLKIKAAPRLIRLKNYSGDGTISMYQKVPIC